MAFTSDSPWDKKALSVSSNKIGRRPYSLSRAMPRLPSQPKNINHSAQPTQAEIHTPQQFSVSCQLPNKQITAFEHVTHRDMGLSDIICRFARGTAIKTQNGSIAIEDLHPGDLVQTKDHGAQPVRWIGSSVLVRPPSDKMPPDYPIRISAGALGYLRPEQDLVVSGTFKVLLNNPNCEALFGSPEALAPLSNMVDGEAIMPLKTSADMMFYNLMFDRHQIITANGLETESYHPGNYGIATMPYGVQSHLIEIFPHLGGDLTSFGKSVRPILKGFETEVLRYG